jgi:hypothetical protein
MAEYQWRKITKELQRRVLVTNNIAARDALGNMSHVWIGTIIKSSEPEKRGKFVTFDDGDMMILDITHYCDIPMPG